MKLLPLAKLVPSQSLRKLCTCPNCWHEFAPESVFWIAVHHRLNGETHLPSSTLKGREQNRFIPERFDPEGRAIDAEGSPCTQLACPRCRLVIPRASLEMESVSFSVLGAPGSGKSVFLASMVFSMRQRAASLGLSFQDADLILNKELMEDERELFLTANADRFRDFTDAVKKTTVEHGRYSTSIIDGQEVKFAYPLVFLLAPSKGHPQEKSERSQTRMLCLYDNAGEQFLPGADVASKPVTRHLAISKGLIYTFDPTKDRRFVRELNLQAGAKVGADRQDVVLMEAANRIREHAGLSRSSKIPQTLVVTVTKFDVWRSLLPEAVDANILRAYPNRPIEAISIDDVEALSNVCRQLLLQLCPEIVTAAESICETVYYIPVASVGVNVRHDARTGDMSFRSADCEPIGVLTPLLALLAKTTPRLVPSLRRKSS